jgi:hypothetical protein
LAGQTDNPCGEPFNDYDLRVAKVLNHFWSNVDSSTGIAAAMKEFFGTENLNA